MVNATEAAVGAGADGLGLALVDLEAFNGPTDDALSQGIPVLSYNADAPNSRLAYVGQDLYGSGFEMGRRIVDLVGSGKVGLFIATPGQLNIQPRIDGALDAIAESGADIEALDIATGADLTEELATVEAWYLGNQDATGMFAVDAGSTQAVGQVVRDQDARSNGLLGAGGYDLLPETVELVADGVLDFTIDQQPYLQGFLPVVYMYLWKLSGGVVTPPETNTGLVFLDSSSAQLFLETESRFEGDAEEQKIVEPIQ
jgi:simple sugar transport system substrate-binding protein